MWNEWTPRDEAAAKWLETAKRALQLEPRNGWARLRLAQRYAMASDFAGVTSNLKQAADVADGNAALMVEVASELPWADQTARAVAMVECALRLDPALSEAARCSSRAWRGGSSGLRPARAAHG